MSSSTPTIGLKKPEGSDPFLTEDFAANYDKIDAAFAQRPVGGTTTTGGGTTTTSTDAQTLQTHPASYFATADHVHAGGGTGTDAATLQTHPASYFAVLGSVNAQTFNGQPSTYFYSPANPPPASGGGGTTYTEPADIVKSPGGSGIKLVFGSVAYNTNGTSSASGRVTFSGFGGVPVVVATPRVPSNHDLVLNTQAVASTYFDFRVAQKDGGAVSSSGTIYWMAVGS